MRSAIERPKKRWVTATGVVAAKGISSNGVIVLAVLASGIQCTTCRLKSGK
jgi:hypothetical protein